MRHCPPTISRTLDIIEKRRLYTFHMMNLNPSRGGADVSAFDANPAVRRRNEKKRYYREYELKTRRKDQARIKRPSSTRKDNSYFYTKYITNWDLTNNTANSNTGDKSENESDLNNTEKSNADNSNEYENELSKTSGQIIGNLVQENEQKPQEHSLSARSPRKKPVIYTISKDSNRGRKSPRQPPHGSDNESSRSPRRNGASSQKSESQDESNTKDDS